MIRTLLLTAILASGIVTSAAPAKRPASSSAALSPETIKAIDGVFAKWATTSSPGCALGISSHGEIVYSHGYGMSNLEYDIAITPQSIFHVASISKQFTAFSVELLAHEGKLSLDDDVRKYVPEVADYGYQITIRQLLQHTSGIRDQWSLLDMAGWRDDDLITESDVLEIVARQRAANFDPGAEYLYSNTGFTLLAVIVKRVSGQSLRDFAAERIFAPLGMRDTQFHDDHTAIVRGRTSAYLPRKDSSWFISIPVFDTYGATNLFTTVGDLLRWEQNFADGRVGGRQLLDEMQTSGRLNDGAETGYGLGLVIDKYRGVSFVGHNGADAGYRTDVVRFPSQDIAIAALCNAGTSVPVALTRAVADIVLDPTTLSPMPQPITVGKEQLEPLAGAYWDAVTDNVRELVMKEGALIVAPDGPPLEAFGPGTFRTTPLGRDWTFVAPAAGGSAELHIALAGTMKPVVLQRLPAVSKSLSLAAFAGRYDSKELDTTFTVVVDNDALLLKSKRNPDIKLHPVTPNMFVNDTDGIVTTFTRNAAAIDGMTISTGRVRRLRLVRLN